MRGHDQHQPNILVAYFCRPAVARRVLSAECSDSPVTTSTRPVTAAESSPVQRPAAARSQQGPGTTVGTLPTVSPCGRGRRQLHCHRVSRVSVVRMEGGEGGGPHCSSDPSDTATLVCSGWCRASPCAVLATSAQSLSGAGGGHISPRTRCSSENNPTF